MNDEYVTVRQLAARVNLSRATIYRLMVQGLPSVRIGHARRFLWRAVEAFLCEDRLQPGDYRCLVCQWTGHVAQPSDRYRMHCPNCQTVVPPMVRVDSDMVLHSGETC